MSKRRYRPMGFFGAVFISAALAAAPAAGADPADPVPAPDLHPATGVADLPILKKDPAAGHLRAGQRVLVDDGSCPASQIKELTGGTDHRCEANAGLLDDSKCDKIAGSRRLSRCVPRP